MNAAANHLTNAYYDANKASSTVKGGWATATALAAEVAAAVAALEAATPFLAAALQDGG